MDSNRIPVICLATTIVLTASIVILIINLNKGVELTARMLSVMDKFKSTMLQPIETKGIAYSMLAVFALCVGVVTLVVDFVNSNSRYRDIQVGQFCEGSTPCSMMILALLATLLAWIWALTKAIEAKFSFEIQNKQCYRPRRNDNCIKYDQYMNFAVPKDYTFIDHCGQAFTKYCVEYIIFGADIFDTVAVCAVLVCICLVNYLMCMASHFAYFMRKPPIPRRQVSASRSFARPSRSRSRSQNWQTRSTSEELYSPPPKGAANSSAPNYDNNPKVTIRVRNVE